jgi:hypothetical protein
MGHKELRAAKFSKQVIETGGTIFDRLHQCTIRLLQKKYPLRRHIEGPARIQSLFLTALRKHCPR